MAKELNKDDILYLHFHIKQKFNPRPINKLDKFNKPITLVSIGFPYQSQYNGCYISVNAAFIKPDKYSPDIRQQISVLANAPIKVYRYDRQSNQAELVTTLLGKDIVKEFDAWKSQEVE